MTEVPKGTNNNEGLTDLMILLKPTIHVLQVDINTILLGIIK
jgi:hypothetical protein